MKISELALQNLTANGLSTEQAEHVIIRAKEAKALDAMKPFWERAVSGYPQGVIRAFLVSLHAIALEWIDKYVPDIWFRTMFLPAQAQADFIEKR